MKSLSLHPSLEPTPEFFLKIYLKDNIAIFSLAVLR